jgi:hypothetical protein
VARHPRTGNPRDFNNDGSIDTVDFQILANHFGTGTEFSQGDNNQDGFVNLQDFIQFRKIFHGANGDSAAAVPEPSGIVLAGLAVLPLGSRRVKLARAQIPIRHVAWPD